MTKIIEGKVIGSISTKNSVAIPPEVLMILGLHPRSKIIFEISKGEVKLKPAEKTNVEDAFGSILQIQKSDNLKLPKGYTLEYQVQKIIRKLHK